MQKEREQKREEVEVGPEERVSERTIEWHSFLREENKKTTRFSSHSRSLTFFSSRRAKQRGGCSLSDLRLRRSLAWRVRERQREKEKETKEHRHFFFFRSPSTIAFLLSSSKKRGGLSFSIPYNEHQASVSRSAISESDWNEWRASKRERERKEKKEAEFVALARSPPPSHLLLKTNQPSNQRPHQGRPLLQDRRPGARCHREGGRGPPRRL